MRLLGYVVAVVAALRLTWWLLRPVLPALAVSAVALVVLRIVMWWRDDRW